MEDFKWRVWARRVAYLDVVVSFIAGLVMFLVVISLGGAYIIFIKKTHPYNEKLVEVLLPVCNMFFNITPEVFFTLAIFLNCLCCLISIFLIRATCSLLSATKSTPKHKIELNTAIEKCKTWQRVNWTGTVVYNALFGVLEACWVFTNGSTNHLSTGNMLLKGLILIGTRLWFQYVVTTYVTELKIKLLIKWKRK